MTIQSPPSGSTPEAPDGGVGASNHSRPSDEAIVNGSLISNTGPWVPVTTKPSSPAPMATVPSRLRTSSQSRPSEENQISESCVAAVGYTSAR